MVNTGCFNNLISKHTLYAVFKLTMKPPQKKKLRLVYIQAASNLTLDTEEYDPEYLRYGGTVGVRNPRLVAQLRGVPPTQQQQHIQMNLMAGPRGW